MRNSTVIRESWPTSGRLAAWPAGVLIAALMALAVAGCAGGDPLVGLFLYNEADPYILEFGRQILGAAPSGFAIKKFDAANSQPIQNEQIDNFLDRRPDLLVVNPVDRLGAYAIIQRARSAAVPVVFFNREPLAADMALWDRVWYVGAKAIQSGRLQAELVIKLFGGDPAHLNAFDRNGDNVIQALILKGEQGHQDAEIRTREVLHSFEERAFRVEVLALEIANWNQAEAYEKIHHLLRQYQSAIELVISNNDAMALGAISRMRQNGWFNDADGNGVIDSRDPDWTPVVGIDGLRAAEQAITEGYLYGTVKNDSLSMALAIIELAEFLLGRRSGSSLSATVEDGRYIWVDYTPYVYQP